MTGQPRNDDLARVRAEFEHWRSQSSGRGRIPDRLWRMAIDLLDHVSTSVVCRELRLAAGDLKKRRHALTATSDAHSPAQPEFVEVRAVDLAAAVNRDPSDVRPSEAPMRLELTRADGAMLALELPSTHWARVEALCIAFLTA